MAGDSPNSAGGMKMERAQMEQSRLKIETSKDQTLAQAMEKKPDTKFLLAYSPTRCAFANWDSKSKKIVSLDGVDVVDIYEVRAFGEYFEIRWVKDSSGDNGRVALLQEGEGDEYHCLPGQYLLWGTADSVTESTVALYEPRLGKMIVPNPSGLVCDVKSGLRMGLLFKEYFTPDDTYGNMFFVAERLTGLKAL
jgi:CRISPR-associated protein (TIGR03984 family)